MDLDENLSNIWVNPFNGYIDITEIEFLFSLKPIFLIGPRGCGKTELFKKLSEKIVIKGNEIQYGVYIDLSQFKTTEIIELVDSINKTRVSRGIELKGILADNKAKFGEFCEYQEFPLSKTMDLSMYYGEQNIEFNETIFYAKLNEELSVNFKYIFVIYFDEYDSSNKEIQNYINTIIKYVGEGSITTYRIAKRVRELKSSETISESEYLKYGSDYREASYKFLKANKYSKIFLNQLANEIINSYGISTDVKTMLGTKENFEKEANRIIGNRKKHFDEFEITDSEAIKLLSCPDKPLIEMMNIVLARRLKKSRKKHFDINVNLSEVENISIISMQYQKKIKNDNTKKYHNDYSNKYRLSLLFILCNIYDQRKSFYSFNTLMYVCSGDLNYFKEFIVKACKLVKNSSLTRFPIDMEVQDNIFIEISKNYYYKTQSENNEVFTLVNNIGNQMRKYHVDREVKYPETTQCFIGSNLGEEYRLIFEKAYYNNDFIKKDRIQKKSIGMGKGSLYVLSKVYAPHYQLSYRIRGGYNIPLTAEMFSDNRKKFYQLNIFKDLEVENE